MNKLIVVDVSVAIKWRLNDEECITEARQLLRDYQEGKIDFLAPKLFLVEVANAFAAAAMRKRLSAADALNDFHAIAGVAFPLVEDADYLESAWQIAMKHSRAIYDSLYLGHVSENSLHFVVMSNKPKVARNEAIMSDNGFTHYSLLITHHCQLIFEKI